LMVMDLCNIQCEFYMRISVGKMKHGK
jgi:hypothetical protein